MQYSYTRNCQALIVLSGGSPNPSLPPSPTDSINPPRIPFLCLGQCHRFSWRSIIKCTTIQHSTSIGYFWATEDQDGAYSAGLGWLVAVLNDGVSRLPSQKRNSLSTALLFCQNSLPWHCWLILYWRGWLLGQTFLLGSDWDIQAGVWFFTDKGGGSYSLNCWWLNFFLGAIYSRWWSYLLNPPPGLVMASKGKISYATCFQSVYIPISYVLKLARVSYPASPKAFSRQFITGSFVKFWMPLPQNYIGNNPISSLLQISFYQNFSPLDTVVMVYYNLITNTCSVILTIIMWPKICFVGQGRHTRVFS